MNIYLYLYLIDILPTIGRVMWVLSTVMLLCGLTVAFVSAMEDELRRLKTPFAKFYIGVSVVFSVIASIIPSKDTMLLMGGVYIGEKALDSELGKKASELLKMELDKALAKAKQ